MGDLKKEESITGCDRPSDTELTRRAIVNARPNRGQVNVMRWVCVRDTFAVGSTTANILCAEAGLDPDEMLDGGYCEGCHVAPCRNAGCKWYEENESLCCSYYDFLLEEECEDYLPQ